eukprot:scaffold404857_cov51-Prasinocladus_malaysianus.AAC.4
MSIRKSMSRLHTLAGREILASWLCRCLGIAAVPGTNSKGSRQDNCVGSRIYSTSVGLQPREIGRFYAWSGHRPDSCCTCAICR